MSARLILDMPAPPWTPETVTAQMRRYAELSEQFTSAVKARDWNRQRDLVEQMHETADELFESSVIEGSWHVEDGDA